MFGFGKNIPSVTVEQAKEALVRKENVIFLDVRTFEEYAISHLTNSLLLPVDEVSKNAEKVLQDKKQKIYVYCRSGVRSARAVENLSKLGYENVFNITNGLLAWEEKGYPVTQIS